MKHYRLIPLLAIASTLQQPPQAHYRIDQGAYLPDSLMTPGASLTKDTSVICHQHTGTVRNVPEREKKAVYLLYGITSHRADQYEVDHLISLELGGSNDITNLWPQPATPKPGFHQKDVLENWLHAQVCAGKLSLDSAVTLISGDWMDAYRMMNGQD